MEASILKLTQYTYMEKLTLNLTSINDLLYQMDIRKNNIYETGKDIWEVARYHDGMKLWKEG